MHFKVNINLSKIVSDQSTTVMFSSVNLSMCRQMLPKIFEPTVLLIYSCWTSMTMWHKQLISASNAASTGSTNDLFHRSLLYYNQIPISIIQQNLGTLLWHTFLRSRIVTLTQLIEKIGKVPKERLCFKELRLNERDLVDFVEQLSKNFFHTFIESIYNHLNEIPIFNIDDVWDGCPSADSSLPACNTIRHFSRVDR